MSKLYNLARMSTATTGTGTVTLGSPVTSYLTFALAGVQNGDVVTYAIEDGTEREIGRGTYTSAGTTLSRDTVLASTNGGSKISLSGTAQVFITAAAEDFNPGVLHVQDQKVSGTNGGTFTSGAWQTRVLNATVLNTITGASLGSNQITLPAGTYDFYASCQAIQVEVHQAKLFNITDTADVILGVNARSRNSGATDGSSPAWVTGRFTIAASKVLELQHRCTTTVANTGFGAPGSWGVEVYADVFIRRIA